MYVQYFLSFSSDFGLYHRLREMSPLQLLNAPLSSYRAELRVNIGLKFAGDTTSNELNAVANYKKENVC